MPLEKSKGIVSQYRPFARDFDRELQTLFVMDESGPQESFARQKGLEELKQLEKIFLNLLRKTDGLVFASGLSKMTRENLSGLRLLRDLLRGKFDQYEYIDLYGEVALEELLAKRKVWLADLYQKYQLEQKMDKKTKG